MPSWLSADEWFSPVAAEVGPDGNLWVADWYNFIIQHNPTPSKARGGYDAKTGKGDAHINPNRDRSHGRIYRVVWDKAPEAKIKSLAGASDAQLVAAMDSDNLFWRQTAQRLLVDGGKKGATALEGEGQGWRCRGDPGAVELERAWRARHETLQLALLSKDPALRRNAITALGNDAAALQLFFDTAVVQDPDLIVRLAAFNKMVEFEDKETVTRAAMQLIANEDNANDEWLWQSLKNAGAIRRGASKLGPELMGKKSSKGSAGDLPEGWTIRYQTGGEVQYGLSDQSHTGEKSIQVSSEKASEFILCINIPVKKQVEYELRGWIKTENVTGEGRGAQLYISGHPDRPMTQSVKGTKDWTEVKVRFTSYSDGPVRVGALFGNGLVSGKAWWDGISLRPVEYEALP